MWPTFVRVFLFVWHCFGGHSLRQFLCLMSWIEHTPPEGWNNWGVYVAQDCCSSESGLCMASATIHGAKHGVRKSLLSSRLFSWQWAGLHRRHRSTHMKGCSPMQGHAKTSLFQKKLAYNNTMLLLYFWIDPPPLTEFMHILVVTEGQAMSSLM